jgi:muramoyltetrapeptide carboxypeptidase LdcA involved in peptidoglycan recycling
MIVLTAQRAAQIERNLWLLLRQGKLTRAEAMSIGPYANCDRERSILPGEEGYEEETATD